MKSLHKSNNKNTLKECVKNLLREDYDAIDYTGASYGMGGYTEPSAATSNLYNTFVKPITDVGKTVIGQSKEALTRLRSLFDVTKETLYAMNPFISADYDSIFEKEDAEIRSIRDEYSDVYRSTEEALNHSDLKFITALATPEYFFTSKAFKDAPEAAADVLKHLVGSREGRHSRYSSRDTPLNLDDLIRPYNRKNENKQHDNLILTENMLLKFLDHPKVQMMASDARELIKKTLEDFVDVVKKYVDVETPQELNSALREKGKVFDITSELQKQQNWEQEFKKGLISFRQKVKREAIKILQDRIEHVMDGDFPRDSYFVITHESAIDKIKSL